jgi:hypothetical protein
LLAKVGRAEARPYKSPRSLALSDVSNLCREDNRSLQFKFARKILSPLKLAVPVHKTSLEKKTAGKDELFRRQKRVED